MKNMFKNIATIALGLALVAVSVPATSVLADEALTATITAPAPGSTFQVGQTVTFRAQARGGMAPYAYVWSFGDGTQGAGQNFTKTYNSAGQRTVRLTVTDFAARATTAEIVVNVTPATAPLTATITAPANGSAFNVGQTITFSGQAAGGTAPYAYVWTFGDGTQGAGQNFTKTYNSAGTRTVRLTVTDFATRVATAEITLNINAAPATLTANIVAPADGASFNLGQTITFSGQATGGTAPYAYVWTFGDGTQGAGQNFTKTYTTTGQKTVRLTVTDFATRFATDSITITINPVTTPTPTVDLKVNNVNGPITIGEGTGATLSWTSTNAAACTATGAWTGTRTLTGSQATGNLAVGVYTYTLTCTGNGGSATDAVTVNVERGVAPLTATITAPANGSAFNVGQTITFSGQAAGGTAPYAYVWTFGDGTQGAGQNFTKTYNSAGTRNVTLTVTDFAARTATASITVTINPVTTPTPTVDLKVNNSDGPVTLTENATANLTWTSANVTACTATGAWTGLKPNSGSETTSALNVGTYTYNLSCTGAGRVVTDSVTLNVERDSGVMPTVDLQGSVTGRTVNLNWTSSNVNACTATGAWTGLKSVTGSETISNVAVGTNTYNLSCTGSGQVVTDSVTLIVTDGDPGALIISNVRVTDITQTTAIVRWTTNRPANSRVIYDTTSHPDISGASEPNFGYAHSTSTLDEDTLVTEHAVPLTGLTANTQYYFRVLSR